LRGRTDVPRLLLVEAVRGAIEDMRGLLTRGCAPAEEAAIRRLILDQAEIRLRHAVGPFYRRAVNATGIILHTGLGRAPLPARAMRQLADHLAGYSLLQVDQETGKRSRRDERIEWLLQQLTGCEAATVVNNNAAATMIVLAAVARGREVIVSRGQLVEIGGSFRLPEVMEASGAKLVEVGSTNKTHPRDYENAITDSTAAILRVHPSNYKISGFTKEVPLEEMVRIAHGRGLVLIDDVGAGALVDLRPFAIIEKIRKNPLARIVRVGKLTLAALEATLGLFFDHEQAVHEVPTLALLARRLEDVAAQAERLAAAVRRGAPAAHVEVTAGASQMGSGSLPTQNIPTRLVAVDREGLSADDLAARLRRHEPPVVARIQDGRVLADPRTLLAGDEEILVQALVSALA
jgi:L-seryl-tRNA(Ser) seleniumtransferase